MRFLIVVTVFYTFCLVNGRPSYYGPLSLVGPPAPGALLKGPSAAATLLGPDGSAITASAIGGAVAAAPKAGGVVTAAVAPGYVSPALAAPALLPGPLLPAPSKALLVGPSGTIATSGLAPPLIAGPAKLLGGYYDYY